MSAPAVVLVAAPNWLGDAVMALPAIDDIRRHFPATRLVVAARAGVADMLALAPGIDEVVATSWRGEWLARRTRAEDTHRLRATGAELAVLFPNSFASAWLVRGADIAERWGYASDFRRRLLTRAIARPGGSRHQGEYYQHLVNALGMANGPLAPRLGVDEDRLAAARALLAGAGWDGTSRLVALAPGAAYGRAKQWLPAHAAVLTTTLAGQGTTCVLVGSRSDAATTAQIRGTLRPDAASRVIDLAGRTSLADLAGVLSLCDACVSNDSGAMHVAAALGTPVVALFGPTREHATRPLTAGWARVLTTDAWCRPCMLRECPLDHRCMSGITPELVARSLGEIPSSVVRRGGSR